MKTYITEIKISVLESGECGTYQKTNTLMRAVIANSDYHEMRMDLAKRLGETDGKFSFSEKGDNEKR